MKVYSCRNCQHLLYFENSLCISCQHPVGYDAVQLSMITLEKEKITAAVAASGVVASAVTTSGKAASGKVASGIVPSGKVASGKVASGIVPSGKVASGIEAGSAPGSETVVAPAATTYTDIGNKTAIYKFCQNSEFGTCNWLIPAGQPSPFCQACQLNRIIPSLSTSGMLDRWKRMEVAKHRLIYSLLRFGLPVVPKTDGDEGIAFDFMADLSPEQRVMTGHDHGVITLNIEEADEAERVRNKLDLGEKYRTLLGHFRHEIGHYYWDLLIDKSPVIQGFRLLFGDEQKDYGEALKSYYQNGAPENWMDHFISPYASAHPWEDWAETWAHYMHLMDTLETAYAFGISIHPGKAQDLDTDISKDPYAIKDFHKIIGMWLPLTFAVNSLNRSMGHPDFYPFVISPVVIEKLRFIHERVKIRTAPERRSKKGQEA